MREDGRIVGGEEWQEKVYNREEWKKFLRMAGNCRNLHMPMELINERICIFKVPSRVGGTSVTILILRGNTKCIPAERDCNEFTSDLSFIEIL
jgi:hypothetical protein